MDSYSILGIEHDATIAEIRAAYYKRALEVHPDKAGGCKTKFQRLVAAFEFLSDSMHRDADACVGMQNGRLRQAVNFNMNARKMNAGNVGVFPACDPGSGLPAEPRSSGLLC